MKPLGAPVSELLPEAVGATALTPRAQKLTKEDLILLSKGVKEGRLSQLTLEDLKSIEDSFASYRSPGSEGGLAVGACSSSIICCCCAASVTDPAT